MTKCEHGDDQLACLYCHAMFSDPKAPKVPEVFFNRVAAQRDSLRAELGRLKDARGSMAILATEYMMESHRNVEAGSDEDSWLRGKEQGLDEAMKLFDAALETK